MKRFVLTLLAINISLGLFAQTDFFYSENGKEEHFKVRKDKIIIKPKSSIGKQRILQQSIFRSTSVIHNDLLIATVDSVTAKISELSKNENIADVYYFLEYVDGTLQSPTDKIFIKPLQGQSIETIITENELATKVEAINLINSTDSIYMLTLEIKMKDVLPLCRSLYETGTVEFAEPSFLREIKLHNTYYSNQWGLKNTGQYGGTSGIDIKAESAWNIARGNGIKVAVIDEGVNLTHSDLAGNMHSQSYDIQNRTSPSIIRGNHGTACAGIVGTIQNNNEGISGVAPNCTLISVSRQLSNVSNLLNVQQDLATGINWAWQNGADVLSNSWGNDALQSTYITDAINNAVTQGRNGKGCVVVFASGNDNASSVSYPASLSNVIAVGAISPCGERKSYSSCDGETWWGSNYGTMLDVVAPGVKIYTTDIHGSAGYNTASGTAGNYYASFNGTSAACPHVAGIAALILSIRPDLTQAQVRQAIESTCTKLSGYSFSSNSNHPSGTWNSEVGTRAAFPALFDGTVGRMYAVSA